MEAGAAGGPDELAEGVLRCTGCGRRYPVIDGIPVICADLAGLLRTEGTALVAGPLSAAVQAVLAEPGPDDAPLSYSVENLGAYLDASWGDLAEPPADGPGVPYGARALVGRLEARAGAKVARAVEVGCGVGRGLAALARGAALVVGLDRSPGALKLARRLLRGEPVEFARRAIGRTYAPARVRPAARTPGVELVCADALEPPLAPGTSDRTVALNLLDVVREPRALLHQLHLLTAAGGEVALGSPYSWRSGVVEERERLGGSDPAAALRAEAQALGWTVEEEVERLPWTLRRDARAASLYEVHWLRARRP